MFASPGKIAVKLTVSALGMGVRHESEDRRPRAIGNTSQTHIWTLMQCTNFGADYFRSHSVLRALLEHCVVGNGSIEYSEMTK